MDKKPLPEYLDAASTTPVDARVVKAMMPYFSEIFGNASSQHIYGQQAKEAVEKAREQVASIVNVEASEIIFTSGATEAINLAIKGYWEANRDRGNHLITVKTEHKAVLKTHEYLETLGVEVTYLGVDRNGLISIEELKQAIRADTLLVSVMHVNNETGLIHDVEEIALVCADHSVAFFTDATQAVAHVPTDYSSPTITMACFSAHKFGGPKGIGALVIKRGNEVAPQIHGGGQESGLRGGTYNTPLTVGFGEICWIAKAEFSPRQEATRKLRAHWLDHIAQNDIGQAHFDENKVAPHILSIELKHDEAENFILLNTNKISLSTGSACSSELIQESHVLEQHGITSNKTIRFSVNHAEPRRPILD